MRSLLLLLRGPADGRADERRDMNFTELDAQLQAMLTGTIIDAGGIPDSVTVDEAATGIEQLVCANIPALQEQLEKTGRAPVDSSEDVCRCGDYRSDHKNGTGACLRADDLCHGFEPCVEFRLAYLSGQKVHAAAFVQEINAFLRESDKVGDLQKALARDDKTLAAALFLMVKAQIERTKLKGKEPMKNIVSITTKEGVGFVVANDTTVPQLDITWDALAKMRSDITQAATDTGETPRLKCPACGADKWECAEMLEGNMTLTCGGCKKTFFLEWSET